MTPNSRPVLINASTALSMSSLLCDADSCTRILAFPETKKKDISYPDMVIGANQLKN